MIKNDALNETVDLKHRWDFLIEDFWNDSFDGDFFKLLAVHTFAYSFPYNSKDDVPREMISVLLKIKEFACIPDSLNTSWDMLAAQRVANEFCEQMDSGWVKVDGEFNENLFVVFGDNDDEYYLIDSNTFDLTEFYKKHIAELNT